MYKLTADQQDAIGRLYEHDAAVLVAPTGVGKTVICLTAIAELIRDGQLHRVIVACPAKVLDRGVWGNEVGKWDHLKGLRVIELRGTAKQRRQLLQNDADVFVVSLNNLAWLLEEAHLCDGIVIDELSKAAGKQAKGLRSKKRAGMLVWRVGMTATPVSQDFLKLYDMCRIIDHGAALGTNKKRYLDTHFYSDYGGYNWTMRDGAAEQIMARVASLVHVVPDNKSSSLPPLTLEEKRFTMPAETRAIYDEMRETMVVEASDVEAANEAVKSGKLRQIASGFVYDEDNETVELDTARFDALREWVDGLAGEPGLVFYEYKAQAEQLAECTKHNDNVELAQIQSMSHGVDGLQELFSDVLFYQPNWSRDATEQAIGRVWRQGQTKPVRVTTLICEDTLDDVVVARVEQRAEWMELFLKHLKGNPA